MKIRVKNDIRSLYVDTLINAGFELLSKEFASGNYLRGKENVNVEIPVGDKSLIEVLKNRATELDDLQMLREMSMLSCLFEAGENKQIRSLKGFMKGVEIFLTQNVINGWIYQLQSNNVFLPFLVIDISHYPYCGRSQTPAHITIKTIRNKPIGYDSSRHRESTSFDFDQDDILDKTVPEILANKGLFHESEDMHKHYLEHLEEYRNYSESFGKQFLVNGPLGGKIVNDRKVINDDPVDNIGSMDQSVDVALFNGSRILIEKLGEEVVDEYENSLETGGVVPFKVIKLPIPFHPYIKVFDLLHHKNRWVLAGFMEKYVYDDNVSEKLVLPEDHCDLVDILITDSEVVLEDIVQGKSGGTIILCRGEAGLGKTLTAQVYSEKIHKPLYEVNAGQLGVSASNIDENLAEILERAEKWHAICLIDESDVYVAARGDSITHNAIVASFLRQLERFSGTIFLTTNRVNDIDDAVLSRSAAVLTYNYPPASDLRKIWRVLADNYKVDLSDEMIESFVDQYPVLAGRDVKGLLKLFKNYENMRRTPASLDLLRKCIMFKGMSIKDAEDKKK